MVSVFNMRWGWDGKRIFVGGRSPETVFAQTDPSYHWLLQFIPFSWVQPTHDPSTSACHICGCPDDVVMQGQVTSKKPELSKWISFFEVDAPKTYQLWMFYTKCQVT
jgi:hypothetical protein